MKYGYSIRDHFNPLSYPDTRDLALKLERLGFEAVHVTDHFQNNTVPYLEAVTLLAALAAVTHTIKLGHVVLCNSYRNPAVTAKIISTLDNISNGRVLMWLGAGWLQPEYKAYGFPFPSPKRRVDELEESLALYKKLFTEDVTDFVGKFWKLERNRNYPKPIQKPYPQIVLGTNGKRMIDIACREADGINFTYPDPRNRLEKMSTIISYIKEKLKKYDRDPSTFEISSFCPVFLAQDQENLEKLRRTHKIMKRNFSNMFSGTIEGLKEKITEAENFGLDKMVFNLEQSGVEDPLEVFSEELI